MTEYTPKVVARFWARIDKNGPIIKKSLGKCWDFDSAGVESGGYGRVYLPRPLRARMAHRVAWELHMGSNLPVGAVILHICDRRSCVRFSHLRIGTMKDNAQDAAAKGRISTTKLTPKQIVDLREYVRDCSPIPRHVCSLLAIRYGVHRTTINRVLRGHTFRLIQP